MGGGYGVFEVVGDGVYVEGAGLFEEFGGGGRDWEELVSTWSGRVGRDTVEQCSPKH